MIKKVISLILITVFFTALLSSCAPEQQNVYGEATASYLQDAGTTFAQELAPH